MKSRIEKNQKSCGSHWIFILLVLSIFFGFVFLWRLILVENASSQNANSPMVTVAKNENQPIRANLGGVIVVIPSYFAEHVEYDNDSRWDGGGEAGNGKLKSNKISKIRSFGFDIRYPDMAGKNSLNNVDSYVSRNVATSAWIRVVVSSGEDYSGVGSVDRMAKHALRRMLDSSREYWLDNYEKLLRKEHGLDVYAIKNINPVNGVPYRHHEHAKDVFMKTESGDYISAYITCSNREIPSAPCTHRFDLGPYMLADVTLSYRRGLLLDWNGIQEGIKKVILGFSEIREK